MHKTFLGNGAVFFYGLAQLDLVTFICIAKSAEYMMEIATSGREIKTWDDYINALIEMSENDEFFSI